jgi:secreted PhoX family phosphatase
VLRCGVGLGAAVLGAGCASVASLNPLAPKTAFGAPAADPTGGNAGLSLPAGYLASTVARPGEWLGRGATPSGTTPAADPATRLGTQHGGAAYFALEGSRRGLLALSHGCTGPAGLPEAAARLAGTQGISVLEVAMTRGQWEVVRPSARAQRIAAQTPVRIAGPAAGHGMMKTAADPTGRLVMGTLANGPGVATPWGTYLCGERDFAAGFSTADQPTAHERRYGLGRTAALPWHETDPRFDTVRHPNEPNRHGWIVEIDPARPEARPVKRTALGRGAHGAIRVAVQADGRAVVYRGEAGPQEHLYKFVSRDPVPDAGAAGGADAGLPNLLDEGQLYAARLDADGTGRWLPLAAGQAPLEAAAGFADAGAIAIAARQAADRVGASRLGACTGLAGEPDGEILYVALAAAPGEPAGRLLRLREEPQADRFEWSPLGLPESLGRGAQSLALDSRGRMWVGGDAAPEGTGLGGRSVAPAPRKVGQTAWLACDPPGSPARPFLVAPSGGLAGGVCWTPDGRTMFVNLRGSTLAVRRNDGGLIGT